MTDKYDCITFHTSACDDHHDRLLNVHGPEGLDEVCPLCEIERLEARLNVSLQAEQGAVRIIDEQRGRIAELESEVEKALAFGYHYRQHPQMRGSSLSACKAVYRIATSQR
jgi:hypothetical protein